MNVRRPLTLLACLLSAGLVSAVACATEPPVPTDATVPVAAASSTGDDVPATAPRFLQADPNAPSIANPVVSFWAKRSDDRRVRMYYNAAPGAVDSSTFLELRVDRGSLAAYPDGRRFAATDSVLITVSLVDAERLIVDCQPSGLRFSADRPATLKMSFAHTDLGETGADPSIERSLRIWRREAPDGSWLMQRSAVEIEAHEVKSDVYGFSGYVIAY
jgi:hypothetical protein